MKSEGEEKDRIWNRYSKREDKLFTRYQDFEGWNEAAVNYYNKCASLSSSSPFSSSLLRAGVTHAGARQQRNASTCWWWECIKIKCCVVWWRAKNYGEELLDTILHPVNRRGAKLHLILEGGGSDHMEKGKERGWGGGGGWGWGLIVVKLIRHVAHAWGRWVGGWGLGEEKHGWSQRN